MQHLDLTDDEAAALTQELHDIVENDRYPFSLSRSHLRCSPRIGTLKAILAKLRPEPVREPLPRRRRSMRPRELPRPEGGGPATGENDSGLQTAEG